MKDLILITAYCPTEEHENNLDRCINSVLECGKHIVLVSHSHIPIHIQKNVNIIFMIIITIFLRIIVYLVHKVFILIIKEYGHFFLIRHFMDLQFIGCFQLQVKLQ